jgi:hypothetical protein
MAVNIQFDVFWAMTPCSFVVGYQSFGGPCCLHHPEDGGSMVLWNICILPQHYTVSKLQDVRSNIHVDEVDIP